MTKNTKITTRIWKGSILINNKVRDINKKYDATITKVKRGTGATDNDYITLIEGDYVTFVGDTKNCVELLKYTLRK